MNKKFYYVCKSQFNDREFVLTILCNYPSKKFIIVNLTHNSFWDYKFNSYEEAEKRIYKSKNWTINKRKELL